MEKLNELVESAKETAAIYGAEWDNALSKYPDGVVQFEVVSTEGETVVTTGRDKKSDSWLCDYLVHCSPANILAIAEAFRSLEQRAEAAEAKLADLEKQETIYQVRLIDGSENCSEWVEVTEEEFNTPVTDKYGKWEHRKLFTRPAPAINLADIVPECFQRLFNHASGMVKGVDWNKGTAARNHREPLCIAVIECREFLRNIEEAK